jgi:hypothetical protein
MIKKHSYLPGMMSQVSCTSPEREIFVRNEVLRRMLVLVKVIAVMFSHYVNN